MRVLRFSGPEGTALCVTAENPLPVSVTGGSASGGLTDAELRASAVPVSIASMPSTPVTGTFWQPTQPVSGTVAVSNFPASQAVTGTFWQATQPVSIAATVATRDLKDNARTLFSCATVIAGVTAVTTEALLTMVPTRAGVASATTTSQSVTSGKTLRIQSITVGYISTAAAVLSMRFALRVNPSGAVAANSPILRIIPVSQQAAALAQAGNEMTIDFPDGLELSGTTQFGITQIGSATTGTCWASVTGFEY